MLWSSALLPGPPIILPFMEHAVNFKQDFSRMWLAKGGWGWSKVCGASTWIQQKMAASTASCSATQQAHLKASIYLSCALSRLTGRGWWIHPRSCPFSSLATFFFSSLPSPSVHHLFHPLLPRYVKWSWILHLTASSFTLSHICKRPLMFLRGHIFCSQFKK